MYTFQDRLICYIRTIHCNYTNVLHVCNEQSIFSMEFMYTYSACIPVCKYINFINMKI